MRCTPARADGRGLASRETYKVDRDFVAVSLSLAPPPAPLGF